MAQNPNLKGLEGNMQAQPRVFAHDAVLVSKSDTLDIPNTETRGCCLYVGNGGNMKVTLESGNTVTFNGVNAGSFLPVLATRVWSTDTTADNILALY